MASIIHTAISAPITRTNSSDSRNGSHSNGNSCHNYNNNGDRRGTTKVRGNIEKNEDNGSKLETAMVMAIVLTRTWMRMIVVKKQKRQ